MFVCVVESSKYIRATDAPCGMKRLTRGRMRNSGLFVKGETMRIEITVARDKAAKMPAGSLEALTAEMTKRVSEQYSDVEVIVKPASHDGLSILRAPDKESARQFVEAVLQEVWESADDWFIQ